MHILPSTLCIYNEKSPIFFRLLNKKLSACKK